MVKPQMSPSPGERVLRFVGDRVHFSLRQGDGKPSPKGWRAYVRTNLGRAGRVRDEIIQSYTRKLPSAGASWRDVAMEEQSGTWRLDLPLAEVGFFQAKAYLVDANGRQTWPDGPNVGIAVHPDAYRTANTIYCAFVRMFGASKSQGCSTQETLESDLKSLDEKGYTVIPPSGKLRHLIRELPHIIETLGCRILHLLPINPTPTTYARFGRFGSPYASQDLTAVDPALVEFDRRATGIDQFRELTFATHSLGGKVFLDIVTNHTGWGSPLQEYHPSWFLRDAAGNFASPGAWGVTWEDLVELDHRNPESWEHLADVFLTWCRRGVDGFRCDAGYKVPMPAWRYITACVRQEFPETIFLLEGLGGSWEATESLLTDGGMQWAYSELFQNYTSEEVARYLDYAHGQSTRAGLYVHYSETHDNTRLAARGRAWALLRNQLCALTSVSGGFGFTCGVEWLATERINVHSCRGLNWGSADNLCPELGALNRLLGDHPCFFDNASLTRLSSPNAAVYALERRSAEGRDQVLILVNTDPGNAQSIELEAARWQALGRPTVDLLGCASPAVQNEEGPVRLTLLAGACHCLAPTAHPIGLRGVEYRNDRAAASRALQAVAQILPVEEIGGFAWPALAERFGRDPKAFLASLSSLDPDLTRRDLIAALDGALGIAHFPQVVTWEVIDARRITLVPSGHWLLVRDRVPFRATLSGTPGGPPVHAQSIPVRGGQVAFFTPRQVARDANLLLERYTTEQSHLSARIRFLSENPDVSGLLLREPAQAARQNGAPLVLLTNGRGGMARLSADLGRIQSKYDCLLGANLHPSVPVDRHVFAKRLRAWLIADHFLTPLDFFNLASFAPGPPARWEFLANAGDGRTVSVSLEVDMLEGRNTTVVRFTRSAHAPASGTELPEGCDVRLTVRIDLEDRNFHWETKRNGGADHHFSTHCRALRDCAGFEFTPADDRRLRVVADRGDYFHQSEWSENLFHFVERERGQTDHGDAYSPGWFDLPLGRGQSVTLSVCADPDDPPGATVQQFTVERAEWNQRRIYLAGFNERDLFGQRLALAAHQFVVRRDLGKTVIAGYPWFLDWGRDTLICARGLLAAGLREDVQEVLLTFARFEQNGTLPNSIYGEDASNRDTSDAPLWFGIVCEELARLEPSFYDVPVHSNGRTVRDVLRSIAEHYARGTPNGIAMDPESALIWSPTHFTWMDTNYPAGTPREGFPIEIQVLWIRLLQQLGRIEPDRSQYWQKLAGQALTSLQSFYWLEEGGYFADCLAGPSGQGASRSTVDRALRSNYLLAVALGLISGIRAQRSVETARRYLVVPGALRTLAPLPVSPPLPIYSAEGRLLNNPGEPYWGHYEGDEDTRRKPAYHNGTAWTWTFPTFCEALALAWELQPEAVQAARAYLASMDCLLTEGCLGQMPEIVDGDAPHAQRGCDAQAWGVTEALRVWKLLQGRVARAQPPLSP